MTYNQSKDLMRKAVPFARKLEGDWSARMSMALKVMVIKHYMRQPFSVENAQILLAKGCSVRKLCKHYGVKRHQILS
ncbi:hypothetical protein HCC36_16140 [Listeria booriae]|uniref:Uncharacterized protein n=1 Tax=Listeria booriae TaxID=1552123 RepID=A0A842G4X6_9LIST|nr:hypothetical protein [Listeria booriae]MBC2294754.1 hypothetical protein [Listeria booriae]